MNTLSVFDSVNLRLSRPFTEDCGLIRDKSMTARTNDGIG